MPGAVSGIEFLTRLERFSCTVMARIRVRFAINEGRHGAPLTKLGRISEQAEKFLKSLAADCDIEVRPGEWVAANFENGSVAFDAEYQVEVNPGTAQIFAHNLEMIADYDPEDGGLNASVSDATTLEYARIGTLLDPDEAIGLGIYPVRGKKPRWRRITYGKAVNIRRQIESPLPTYGTVQGIIHAWFKEAREPYFQLRELSTDSLIKVTYASARYADVAKAIQERTTMLMVSGNMMFDRATRSVLELHAESIERMKMLSGAEFEQFFGSAPDFEAVDFLDESQIDG